MEIKEVESTQCRGGERARFKEKLKAVTIGKQPR